MATPQLNAVVRQRIEVSPGLVILRVVPHDWELPEFIPGQFGVLGLPGSARRDSTSDGEEEPAPAEKLIKRAYSIASSSVAREFMEFYISLVRSGSLTPRIFALEVGDRIWLSPKVSGVFTLDEVPADKHVVLISTGTGLAPYMSMLRTQLVCGGPRRFAVLHGARHSWDLGYQSELLAVQRMCGNFSYLATISRPEEEPVRWNGHTGYLQSLWNTRLLDQRWGFKPLPENTHAFLCGSPAMIQDFVKLLGAEGFREATPKQPGEVHVERYW
jgi:ferredoxin--NADP+ reductase